MIKIKIRNATGEEELIIINDILKYLDCREAEIISTKADRIIKYRKEPLGD